jgi:hypothetical protein
VGDKRKIYDEIVINHAQTRKCNGESNENHKTEIKI